MLRKASFLDAAVKQIEGNIIRGIASQQVVDRDNEVILVSGIQTGPFLANPALLANHDREFSLGTVTRLWTATPPGGPALMFEAQLVERLTSSPTESGVSQSFVGASKNT